MTKGERMALADQAREAKAVWLRAGSEHRPIAIWIVVVENRLFVRSWNARPEGWHRAAVQEKTGTMRLSKAGPEVAVRAVRTRSERLKAAVDRAFAAKYTSPSNLQYVKGFRAPRRRDTTTELIPL